MDNYILAYYQGIRDGSICVGRWIRLLYEKIVAGIEDGTYIFDQRKANRAIQFFERFVRHNKGPLAPGLLKLSLWQKAILSIVYGIVDENGLRIFRELFLVVGRKCGKTLLSSGMIAYTAYAESFAEGGFGAEIYCVAPKLDQSDLVYSAYEFTMSQNPEFERRTNKRKNDYYIPATNTTVKKIAFNEKKADGYNPMLSVCDEMSSWPAARGLRMYEVLVSGTTAREQPLTVSISSAGYVDEGIYDELMRRGTRWLLGDSKENRLLPVLFMIDDINKWDDVNELRKSLPGLGVSVKVQTILDEIDIAHESLSKKSEFITKYCNIKQNSSTAWLDAQLVEKACGPHFGPEDLRDSYCVAGIDLSQSRDLTAASVIVEKSGEFYILTKFWLPSARIQEAIKRDGLPYDIYIKRGILAESGENFVDYQDCYNWLTELVEKWQVLPLKIGYDKWSSQYLVQDLKKYGFHTVDIYQDNLWQTAQEFLGLLEDGKIHIGDNDLLKVHFLNAAIKMSVDRGKGKIIKINPYAHVDGLMSVLDGFKTKSLFADEIGAQLKNEE